MAVNTLKGAIKNLRNVDFLAEATFGDVPGYHVIHKFAYNPDIDLGDTEDVWDVGSDYLYFDTAEPMEVVSNDASDNVSGIGAHTVKVFYLNSGFAESTEVVTLTGTTAVALIGTARRTWRAQILTAGTSGGCIGNISIQGSGGGDLQAFIASVDSGGGNQTLMSQYTIPASHTATVLALHFSTGKNKDIDYLFQTREQGEVFRTQHRQDIYQNAEEIIIPIPLKEKTDIRIRGLADAANTPATCDYAMLLKHKV
ncbi:MAG TPA: hypothetical protein ENH82_13000 [bacterium]|nr:hypothetical protein [bacterium]